MSGGFERCIVGIWSYASFKLELSDFALGLHLSLARSRCDVHDDQAFHRTKLLGLMIDRNSRNPTDMGRFYGRHLPLGLQPR